MSRLKLCLVVFVMVLAIGITAGVSIAFADETDLYIEADISLTSDSVLPNCAVAQAKYWKSTDKKTWEEASDFKSDWVDLVYFNAGDDSRIGTSAPTTVGKYIVRAIVNGNYNQNNYFLSSTKLHEGLVLSSFSYQIVYENLAVIFAPNKNVDFQEGYDYSSEVTDGTKVYYKGDQLAKDTDYTIELAMLNGEVYENVTEAINPGMYKITVRLNASYPNANITTPEQKTFVSTFEIVNSLANAVKLSSTKIYEGMYQSDEAMRADYYSVKYEGIITTDTFKDKYTVSYLADNKTISAPILAGDYTVRFTFTSNIDMYGITAGDFIDLPYTIHKKPYSVSYDSTATSTDGYSLIYQGKAIAITPKFDKNLTIDAEKTVYFQYTSHDTTEQLTYGELPTEIGRYQAKFYIDLTKGDITSEAYFGIDDKDYAITDKNNELVYEFQIIPRMSVNFASDYSGEQGFSSVVDYTGKRAKVINSLQDSTLADIPEELYSIEYYDSAWNITDAIIPGEYTAVITFNINNETKSWTNGGTVIQDQTKLYYKFKVAERQANITAKKVSGGILLNFGPREIQLSDYEVKYYRFENNLNYSTTQSDLINVAGTYHIVVSFNADHFDLGIANGDVFVLDYENKADGSLDIVTLSLDNAIDTGNGYTVKYDGNIKNVNIAFDNLSDELIQTLNYSFYYQKLNRKGNAEVDSDWTVCDYPKMPGGYRAVMVVNQSNINFNAKTGDKLTYYFTITALDLTPTFTVKQDEYTKDLVYDNNPNGKDFNVTFTSNGRPVSIDRSLYSLRYSSRTVDGTFSTFTTDNPINAGDYIIAVYFNYGEDGAFEKYGIFTDEPTIINPDDFTSQNMAARSVFSSVVRVEKLVLTIVAGIPVEEKAMYRLDGGDIKPTYTYYKTNGYPDFTTYQELLTEVQNKKDKALTFIVDNHFDSELFTGDLNSISCDILADDSKETGRYVNNLSLKEEVRNNIVIDKVLYSYVGTKSNGEYSSDLYNASKISNYSLTVQYLIKPLPLIINSTDLESIAENDFAEHYYGNTAPITGDMLIFSTVDQDGNKYEIKDQFPLVYNNLSRYVALKYYKRLTGESVTEKDAMFVTDSMGNPNYDLGTVDDYFFKAGDYSLRITFGDIDNSDYKHFTLVNGRDENGSAVNGSHLEGSNYTDIEFTVKTANSLRVVFERDFKSFVYDGSPKSFNIKFMSGNNEVTIPHSMTRYIIDKDTGSESVWTDSSYPNATGDYAIQIKFDGNLYSYKIEQGENAGEFFGNSNYIEKDNYVKFFYSIKAPLYLGWSFTKGDELPSGNYNYSGENQEFGIKFFDASNPDITVNLINNIDYAIWYYQTTDGEKYTKLLSAPTEPGKYVVELVFLRTLYDYKVSEEIGIPYSYVEAVDGKFGQSISTTDNSVLSLNMFNEKRYLKIEIVPTSLLIGGKTISDKSFDNTYDARMIGEWSIGVDENDVLVDSYRNKINELLSGRIIARFDGMGVGEHTVSLYYSFLDSESVLLKLPQNEDIIDITSYQFIKNEIERIKNSEDYSSVKADLDAFEALIDEISKCYNITFDGLTASIAKHVVTINAKPFTREYDPFYRDSNNLEFSYSDDLLSSLISDEQIFIGNLSRYNSETENSVGTYRIDLGSLSLNGDIDITLASGEDCKLSDCFALEINDRPVYYSITKRQIVVTITSGLEKFYDEDDPAMECKVTSGSLISGDCLVFTDDNKPIIQYGDNKARHDVGSYSIDISPITIKDSQGTDVKDNYRILPVKYDFTVKPKAISIFLQEVDNIDYSKNFYVIYALGATDKKYVVQYDNNGIKLSYDLESKGLSLSGNFGLEQVADTSPLVCEKYRITLGNIGVVDHEGNSVTTNFIITQSNTAYYTIMKYNLVLELSGNSYKKTYSFEDPIIALKQNEQFPLPAGCTLREDSSATRAEGEAVGKYEIKNNDSSKIYIVNDEGKIITKYFNVTIRNEKNVQFEIEKFLLKVSVKEETFVKGDSTIIGKLQFKDAEGKNVPQAVLDKISVTFDPIILDNPVEGINTVIPTYSASVVDENFEIETEAGVITVIFPENIVTYKTIDKESEVMKANSFILVDAKLLETKQMFLASTENGQNPTKMITITIPIDSELYEKELYVVAVRSDGKYEIIEANVTDGAIVVTDDEFNYIMLCSLKTWPYYLIGGIVILIILAILAFVLGKLARRKRRNGEKAVNFRKRAKEESKKNSLVASGFKPNQEANGNENDLDDMVDVAPTRAVKLDSLNKNSKKDKKNKAVEDNKQNENTDTLPTEATDSAPIVPVSQPKVEAPKEEPSIVETPKVDSADDEIIIAPSRKLGSDTSAEATDINVINNVEPTSSSDDEIIISTSRKLLSDDDE